MKARPQSPHAVFRPRVSRNKRPVAVAAISILAILNGSLTVVLGVMTPFGSRVLFTPSGYGPNRIAMSELFGPLAGRTGWIFLALGILFVMVGYGLFTLREWARLALFWVFAVVAAATLVAVGWGIYHGEVGVVLSGLLKAAVDVALCRYLTAPGVRGAFAK